MQQSTAKMQHLTLMEKNVFLLKISLVSEIMIKDTTQMKNQLIAFFVTSDSKNLVAHVLTRPNNV